MGKAKPAAKSKLKIDLEEIKKSSLVLRSINRKTRQDILNLLHTNKGIRVTESTND